LGELLGQNVPDPEDVHLQGVYPSFQFDGVAEHGRGLGYAVPTNNVYRVFEGDVDDDDNATDNTVATIAAAATTGSTLGTGTAASNTHPGLIEAINQSIAPVFNQVVQNQSTLQNQIAAMLLVQPPLAQVVPSAQHVAFPMQQPFQLPMQQQQYQTSKRHGMDVASKANSRVDVADKEAMDGDMVVVTVDASVILPLCQ
jgi:hypothetical protein